MKFFLGITVLLTLMAYNSKLVLTGPKGIIEHQQEVKKHSSACCCDEWKKCPKSPSASTD